jgi:HK97 family phage portal protein
MPTRKSPAKAARSPRRRKASPRTVELRGIEPLTYGYWGGDSLAEITPQVAMEVTGILACVRFIAQACASMPSRIIRTLPDGRKERATDLSCYHALCVRPNKWMSSYDFKQLEFLHMGLYGRAFARIVPGDRGFLTELRPLHPSRMRKPQMLSDGTLAYSYLMPDNSYRPLSASEVIHYRWLSDDGIDGMVPSELCSTSVRLARAIDQAAVGFWKNNARPDYALETAEKIPPEAMERLRSQMREIYGGAGKRGLPAVMPKGVSMKTIESNSAESSQLIEQRDAVIADCARVYGVPSTLVGDNKMARWSNVEQEFITAQVFCLNPWQQRYEGAVDIACLSGFVDDGDQVAMKLDNRGLLRGDTAARTALYQALWQMGAISPNEVRDLEDLPLLEDDAANQTFVQLGFSTLANAAAQAAQPAPQE